MKHDISIAEILGTIHDGTVEVCAGADAKYDAAKEKVSVALSARLRPAKPGGDAESFPEVWLPSDEEVCEHLPRTEADEFVTDVFQSWIKKIRSSVPSELCLRP